MGGSALAADLTTVDEMLTTTVGTVLATSALRATEATTLTANVVGLGVEAIFPAISDSRAITAQLLVTDTQSLPDGYTLLDEMVEIIQLPATEGVTTTVTQPVTVTFHYQAASNRGSSSAAPTFQQWNSATQQWDVLPTTSDPVAQTVQATIVPIALVALLVPEEAFIEPELTAPVTVEESNQVEGKAYFLYLPLVEE